MYNYDEDPVYYCPRCLSLNIKADIADYCYCDDCGSTRVETTDIFTWENLYKARHGFKFTERININ